MEDPILPLPTAVLLPWAPTGSNVLHGRFASRIFPTTCFHPNCRTPIPWASGGPSTGSGLLPRCRAEPRAANGSQISCISAITQAGGLSPPAKISLPLVISLAALNGLLAPGLPLPVPDEQASDISGRLPAPARV